MDVADRAVHRPRRHLEQDQAPRTLDHARRAAQQARVAAALDDRVDPCVFLEAVAHQDLGAPHEQDLARPDLEIVGVLAGAGRDLDLAEVADQGAGDGPEIRQGGQDAQRRLGGSAGGGKAGQEDAQQADRDDGTRRRAHQKRSVGWAPRMNVPWRKNSSATRSTAPEPSVRLYWARKRRNSDGLNCR